MSNLRSTVSSGVSGIKGSFSSLSSTAAASATAETGLDYVRYGSQSAKVTYDAAADTYQVMCGNDSLTRFQIQATWQTADGLVLTGVLEDLAQQAELARFEAVLQPRDNMFGYAITGLTLV